MLAPLRARVPEPVLVRPPVVAAEAPDIVRVVPAVETSIVPVLAAVMVNARSVLAVTPVYTPQKSDHLYPSENPFTG